MIYLSKFVRYKVKSKFAIFNYFLMILFFFGFLNAYSDSLDFEANNETTFEAQLNYIEYQWDLKDNESKCVAHGIYIYTIKSASSEIPMGKLAVAK